VNRIEQQHRRYIKTTATIDRLVALGSDAAYPFGLFAVRANDQPERHGNWIQVFERRGSAWKISASSFSPVPSGPEAAK